MIASVNDRMLPASIIQRLARDPADAWPGAPPNLGTQVVPHITTVSSFVHGSSPAYSFADEALRDSPRNAEVMRTECAIMECLEARQRATALLKWHLVPEDENDQSQKDLVTALTKIIERTPQFLELRRNLMEAIWYGRYAVAMQFTKQQVGNDWRTVVSRWEPRHGDKLVFRADDGSGQYDPGQVGIRIGQQFSLNMPEAERRRKVQSTQHGLVYWFDDFERKTLALHRHLIEDGPFNDQLGAGRINGVGVRDRIYWAWYAMQECLANLLEYLERSALGIEIWRFPAGNAAAEERTRKAAQERVGGGRSIVLVPVTEGENADLFGVQHIEPGLGGVEALKSIIQDYFGAKIKRYILGQTLTSEAAGTGLGSGVADAHLATFADIVQYDSIKLAETLTTDFVRPMQLWNFPKSRGIHLQFKIDTESDDSQSKLAAYEAAWNMGAKLRSEDVMQIIGARRPNDGDEVLQNPQFAVPAGQQSGAAPQRPTIFPPLGKSVDRDATVTQQGPVGEQPQSAGKYGANEDVENAARETVAPTDAQAESGNYRKGKVKLHGLTITIENAKGTRRRPEWPELAAHYGYINRTEGRDGDHVDVFIGPHPESEVVYVIDQPNKGGRFDEHKVMLGYFTEAAAVRDYLANYTPDWQLGHVTPMTIQQFKAWLADGDQMQPVNGQVSKYAAEFDESKVKRDEGGRFAPKANRSSFDSEPGNDFRAKAMSWSEKNLLNKSFVNTATGTTIKITKRGIKKTLSHLPDEKPGIVLSCLPELLQKADYSHSTPNRDPADKNIKAWHHFMSDVNIDGQLHETTIKVREDSQGHLYYDQLVQEKKKGPPYKPVVTSESTDATGQAGEPSTGIIGTEANQDKQKFSAIHVAEIEVPARMRLKPNPEGDASKPHAGTHISLSDLMRGAKKNDGSDFVFDASLEKYAEKWITVGGHEDGDKKHAGGTPLKIETTTGDIVGGPKALADKGVKNLKDFGSATGKRNSNDSDAAKSKAKLGRETIAAPNPLDDVKPITQHESLPGQKSLLDQPSASSPPTTKATPTHSLPKTEAALRAKLVEDFGEFIPGARKHDAKLANEKTTREKPTDERPAWARRYNVSQIAKSSRPGEEGKWSITDDRTKDYFGQPKKASRILFATKEEAEKAIPLIEAQRNHSITQTEKGEPVDQAAYDQWLKDINEWKANLSGASGSHPPQPKRPPFKNEQWAIVRHVSDRKRPVVKGGFASRDEATAHLLSDPASIIEHKFPSYETYQYLDRVDRVGPQHRDGEVKPSDFHEAFQVRGGQFGNWQSGKDGQTSLNHAYDSFHDLANVLGVDPKAMGLNGDLAMAFGARGTGGKDAARAHYEPDQRVINLTKMAGAGSLAHEWAHALDHVIGKTGGHDGHGLSETHYKLKLRPEVAAAAKELRDVIHAKSETSAVKVSPKAQVDEVADLRRFMREKHGNESLADTSYVPSPATVAGYLHNLKVGIRSKREWKGRNNKKLAAPMTAAEHKEWDELSAKIAAGDVGERKYDESGRTTYENVAKLNDLHKKLAGSSFHTGNWQTPSSGHWLVQAIERKKDTDARVKAADEGKTETRKVPTSFLADARKLDETSKGDYYAEPHEMLARAFESYVADKLDSQNRQSDYLIGKGKTEGGRYRALLGASPFPEGEERTAINAAFDKLFATLRGQELPAAKPSQNDKPATYTHTSHEMDQPERYEARWITIGGKDGTGGGAHVKIDSDSGDILAGPKALADQGIRNLKHFGDRPKPTGPTKSQPQRISHKNRRFDVALHRGEWHYRAATGGDWTKANAKTSQWIADAVKAGAPTDDVRRESHQDKFDKAIRDAVGDDPDDQAGFRQVVEAIHKRRTQEVTDSNHSLKNLLGQFGYTGARQGAFIRTVQKADDPDKLAHLRFDQMVEMAMRDHPDLLEHDSIGGDDPEHALFNRLQRGLTALPAKHDPDIIAEALDYSTATSFDPDQYDTPEWREIMASQFTSTKSKWWECVKYVAKHQLDHFLNSRKF